MYSYYFGYGANQNIEYLLDRYNNDIFCTNEVAIILNYEFKLCYSKEIDSVISTIKKCPYNIVYGILYKVSDKVLNLLDKQEHVNKNIYERKCLPIVSMKDGKIKNSYVYIACNDEYNYMASNFEIYKNIILYAVNNINSYPKWYNSYINNIFDDYYKNPYYNLQ